MADYGFACRCGRCLREGGEVAAGSGGGGRKRRTVGEAGEED